jgi:hypothetical protein
MKQEVIDVTPPMWPASVKGMAAAIAALIGATAISEVRARRRALEVNVSVVEDMAPDAMRALVDHLRAIAADAFAKARAEEEAAARAPAMPPSGGPFPNS